MTRASQAEDIRNVKEGTDMRKRIKNQEYAGWLVANQTTEQKSRW